jgi:hypothetical protein
MLRATLRNLAAVPLVTFLFVAAHPCRAQGVRPPVSEPYLFYNYYVPPHPLGGVGAALYPAPRTTIPPLVGHTYITYQALAPHEFLYCHNRTYYRYHPGSGWTKARVCWW